MDESCRKALKVSVCAINATTGFTHATEAAVETQLELIQSFIFEVGRNAHALAELSGRTNPLVSDVTLALIETGFNLSSLPSYLCKNQTAVAAPLLSAPLPQSRSLSVGTRVNRPNFVPDHLPDFPDPHSYIKTLTVKLPPSDYQSIREKAASQKRDVELALTKFIAKTGDTENLFSDDPYAFPLIACKPKALPYLDALLPKDQELESQDDVETTSTRISDDASVTGQEKPAACNKPNRSSVPVSGVAPTSDPPSSSLSKSIAINKPESRDNSTTEIPENETLIDNPFLRPIKMPKLSSVKSKTKW